MNKQTLLFVSTLNALIGALIAVVGANQTVEGNLWRRTLLDRLRSEQNFRRIYSKIGDYLADELGSNKDARANLVVAEGLLERLKRTTNETIDEEERNERQNMIKALEQFTHLRQVINKSAADDLEECGSKNNEILRENYLSANMSSWKARLFRGRIGRIVQEVAREHAEYCYGKYPANYRKLANRMDSQKRELVERMLDELIIDNLMRIESSEAGFQHMALPRRDHYNRYMYTTYITNEMHLQGFQDAAILLRAIKREANSRELPGRELLDSPASSGRDSLRTVVERAIDEFVVEPCRYYVEQLGESVFEPANFDARIYKKSKAKEARKEMDQFYLAWNRYAMCKEIIGRDSKSTANLILRYLTES